MPQELLYGLELCAQGLGGLTATGPVSSWGLSEYLSRPTGVQPKLGSRALPSVL